MVCVQRSEDNLGESFLVFSSMDPGDQPEMLDLVASYLHTDIWPMIITLNSIHLPRVYGGEHWAVIYLLTE